MAIGVEQLPNLRVLRKTGGWPSLCCCLLLIIKVLTFRGGPFQLLVAIGTLLLWTGGWLLCSLTCLIMKRGILLPGVQNHLKTPVFRFGHRLCLIAGSLHPRLWLVARDMQDSCNKMSSKWLIWPELLIGSMSTSHKGYPKFCVGGFIVLVADWGHF